MIEALLYHLDSLLSQYGYTLVGIVITLESMGLPVPAESLLIATAIYVATTKKLNIGLVAVVGIIGAIVGDNFGYLIGRHLGFPLLIKHGWRVGLTPQRIALGRYVFKKHGGKMVFLGRFVAVLRIFVALLAGANKMPWRSFLFWNVLGGVVWAGGYTFAAYYFGKGIIELAGWIGIVLGCCVGIFVVLGFIFLKKNEIRLTKIAMEEMEDEQEKRN